MWYFLYNILLFLSAPLIVIILLLKKRCRRGLGQRVGLTLPEGFPPDKDVLWIHAVSMGEVIAATPLVTAIHHAHPHLGIIISTITETGREAVEQRLAGIARHCYLPLDWSWVVRRVIGRLRPKVFLVIETELWPNLLKELHVQGVSNVLVNGRLSTKSFERYRWVKSFMSSVLSSFQLCLVQSDRDAQRLTALGAQAAKVHRTGNMKFDIELVGLNGQINSIGPKILGVQDDEMLIVAGSTHPKEEEVLLSCYQEVLKAHPRSVLLLAPRHIERSEQLEDTIRSFGFPAIRRSLLEGNDARLGSVTKPRVIVLDTRGELAQVYALARVTFVGGTFVSVGGHNLLEPASWGKPVLFGPYTDHCQEIANFLLESGGGSQVRDSQEMSAFVVNILNDQFLAERMGQAARQVVFDNQGVVKRNIELLRPYLELKA